MPDVNVKHEAKKPDEKGFSFSSFFFCSYTHTTAVWTVWRKINYNFNKNRKK